MATASTPEHRAAINAWLHANNIDPADVADDGFEAVRRGHAATVDVEYSEIQRDDHGQAVTTRRRAELPLPPWAQR
ncbi:hypothetical protein [Streptomyces sp. MP131-18]|uniref:hypothetical protein n=1 Tax=Streptomyces sp. MP131-18 TaxID=1857892 RepID=UPI00097C6F6B|nr:hypothetical protein [Streptomyces sp. MP131-18]ONK09450.1 hypothetical protein STBA_01500 [Streptomyces sp. MP131-18]